jgi:hypothetical protein
VIRSSAFVLLLVLVVGGASVQPVAAQSPIVPMTIGVGGNVFTLAPADADAFQRRINRPPLLDDAPVAAAPFYIVTTAYWDDAIREDEDEAVVAEEAEYFPAGGFVRARQGEDDAWIVLDLRQRAILDHYILYGTQQRLPQDPSLKERMLHPSALLIVFLAYYGVGETIAIEVGNGLLEAEEADAFLASIAPHLVFQLTFLDPQEPPEPTAEGYWVTFTLPEGRTLQYFLDTSASTLTDSLGTEVYDISSAAGGGIPESAAATQIEQEDPVGSALWWLAAVAGVAALVALAFRARNGASIS